MIDHETVGREDVIAQLDRLIRDVAAGRGASLSLVGGAGIGKSHLVRVALRRAGELGVVTVSGRATDLGTAEPYRPLVEVVARAAATGGAASDYEDLVNRLVSVDDRAVPSISPITLGEVVLHVCGGRLVSIEDLHWADTDSLAAIQYVADHAAEAGIGLLLTARDLGGEVGALLRRSNEVGVATTLEISPLDLHQTATLTAAIAGPIGDAAARAVHRWSGGVPLVVAALAAEPEGLEAVVRGWPSAPSTFADVVLGRFGSLRPEARQVVAAAALLGDDIAVSDTAMVADVDRRSVVTALRAAVDVGLVSADGTHFVHVLTRIAILDSMLAVERTELAERALEALPDAPPACRARLARDAGRTLEAATLLAEAGDEAARIGALSSAQELYRQSLALRDDEGVRVGLVEALVEAGQAAEAIAETHDLTCSDEEHHHRLVLARVRALRDAGRIHDAEMLVASATGGGRADRQVELALLAVSLRLEAGDAESAGRLLRGMPDTPDVPAHLRYERSTLQGRVDRERHDTAAAQRAFASALEIAERMGSTHRVAAARFELGTIDFLESRPPDLLVRARRDALDAGALRLAIHAEHLTLTGLAEIFQPPDLDDEGEALVGRCRRLGLEPLEAPLMTALAFWGAARGDAGTVDRWLARMADSGRVDEWSEMARAAPVVQAMVTEDRAGTLEALRVAAPHRLDDPGGKVPWWFWGDLALALEGGAVTPRSPTRPLGVAIHTAAGAVGAAVLGDTAGADDLAARALCAAEDIPVVRAMLQRFLAEGGLRHGFGRPVDWLAEAVPVLESTHLVAMTERARSLAADGDEVARGPLAPPVPPAFAERGVTEREFEVLRLLVDGLGYSEIGARVHLSPRTVEGHVARARARFDGISRVELIVRAAEAIGRPLA